LPHAGHETSEADTHVESYDDVLSDAGSTPAASTTFPQEISEFNPDFPPPPLSLHGLQWSWTVEQSNRRIERRRTQVHVALRQREGHIQRLYQTTERAPV